jgi:pyruvate,water dikinase
MRWEEMWDIALRIRSRFLVGKVPAPVLAAVRQAVDALGPTQPLAVRSSAPGEDHGQTSFAGLHESDVGITGKMHCSTPFG